MQQDTSNVRHMGAAFNNADAFNQPIGIWDTSSLENLAFAFAFNSGFNQGKHSPKSDGMPNRYLLTHVYHAIDISLWDVSSVTTMNAAFRGASSFNQDLSLWDISSVNTMENMFFQAAQFNQNLCLWGPDFRSETVNVTSMFASTSCPETGDPDLTAAARGPLCAVCT